MLVGGSADQAQVAILEDGVLVETYVDEVARSVRSSATSTSDVCRTSCAGWKRRSSTSASRATPSCTSARSAATPSDIEGGRRGGAPTRQRIDEVLASGQTVLVQVTKDPMGTKGARLTTEVSIAGPLPRARPERVRARHLAPPRRRRAPAPARHRPADPSGRLRRDRPHGRRGRRRGGARAGRRASDAACGRRSTRRAEKGSAPLEIYVEPDLVIRIVRDLFSRDYDRLVIEDRETYERVAGLPRRRRARPRRASEPPRRTRVAVRRAERHRPAAQGARAQGVAAVRRLHRRSTGPRRSP